MKKKSDEQRLAAVLSFRVPQQTKVALLKEAAAETKRLGDYLFDLLVLGRETMQARPKTAKAETAQAAEPRVPTAVTDGPGEIPTARRSEKAEQDNLNGPVTESGRRPNVRWGKCLKREKGHKGNELT